MKTKFVIALSLVFNVLLAQHKNPTFLYDPGAAPRDHNLNFERMRLYVEFEPVVGLVKGKITHFFSDKKWIRFIWMVRVLRSKKQN
jgi:hypothetical protein